MASNWSATRGESRAYEHKLEYHYELPPYLKKQKSMFRFYNLLEPTDLWAVKIYCGIAKSPEAIWNTKKQKYCFRGTGMSEEFVSLTIQYFSFFSAYSMFKRFCIVRLCASMANSQAF